MHEVVLTLISDDLTGGVDSFGEPVPVEATTAVFALKKSVKRSEFYQAAAAGLRPEVVFEIYAFEYDGQKKVELNDERFNVIRTYPLPDDEERIELICNTLAEVG